MATDSENVGIPREYLKAVKDEAIKVAAKWTAGLVVLLIGAAVSGWYLYLQDYIIERVSGVPKNALVMFPEGCPDRGWKNVVDKDASISGQYLRIMSEKIPRRGGQNEFALSNDYIPPIQVRTSTNYNRAAPHLWGMSGPNGEGKEYSFADKDGGRSGTGPYPIETLYIGTPNAKKIPIEPGYFSVMLCQKT